MRFEDRKRDLARLARNIDRLRKMNIGKEAEYHLTWGLHNAIVDIMKDEYDREGKFPQSKDLQECGAKARRSNGKQKDILAAYDHLGDRPPRERATLIANQLDLNPRYVRRVIRKRSQSSA